MKRLLFIHSVFIHSGTILSDGGPYASLSLDFSRERQTGNKQETSGGTEVTQRSETECPETKGLHGSFTLSGQEKQL